MRPAVQATRRPAQLWNENDVSGPEVDVLLVGPRRHLVVVERNPDLFVTILSQDDDPGPGRELIESAGQGQDVEHRRAALELVTSGLQHLTDDGDLEAVHIVDDDGDGR